MATTAFVWSEALVEKNGDLNSFFLTAQKNGLLVLCTVKVLSNFTPVTSQPRETDRLEVEVRKILKPRIGKISSLELLQLDEKTSALFIGGLNGKLKVVINILYYIRTKCVCVGGFNGKVKWKAKTFIRILSCSTGNAC